MIIDVDESHHVVGENEKTENIGGCLVMIKKHFL
jgi:hypothetical protein